MAATPEQGIVANDAISTYVAWPLYDSIFKNFNTLFYEDVSLNDCRWGDSGFGRDIFLNLFQEMLHYREYIPGVFNSAPETIIPHSFNFVSFLYHFVQSLLIDIIG